MSSLCSTDVHLSTTGVVLSCRFKDWAESAELAIDSLLSRSACIPGYSTASSGTSKLNDPRRYRRQADGLEKPNGSNTLVTHPPHCDIRTHHISPTSTSPSIGLDILDPPDSTRHRLLPQSLDIVFPVRRSRSRILVGFKRDLSRIERSRRSRCLDIIDPSHTSHLWCFGQ